MDTLPVCSRILLSRKNMNLNSSGVDDILKFLCIIYKLLLDTEFSDMVTTKEDFVSKKINTKLNQQIEVRFATYVI